MLNLTPKKILIIKPSAIGDVVHTLPILNLVRTRWPDAHIAWLVTPGCAGMIDGHPQLDEIILFDRKRLAGWWRSPKTFAALSRFKRELRAKQFDLVLDLQGLFRSGWLARKTRAPVRVGFRNAREFAWAFYTHRVPIDTMEQHAVDRYLKLARYIGCEGETKFVFPHTDTDRATVRTMLADAVNADSSFSRWACPARPEAPPSDRPSDSPVALPYAILAPTTNWETKRWPSERFAALVPLLRDRFGLASVLIGGPDVAGLSAQIPGAINLGGKTSLRELCALIEGAQLVIANDSGPMHIAAAMNRPLVTVFGPTNPVRTGPYQRPGSVVRLALPCSPCYSRTCSHQSCLKWLPEESVAAVAAKEMGVSSPAASPAES
ncbi:MAG TPA: glycosyltransferase family 9 protein [Tepidisphaeraceae bacterium]|nr:glycosyltransferase family 9 protein [Tepidisphaeraceae bacterium]